MNVLRRLFGNVSTCAGCEEPVRERERKPCPKCGETARIHARFVKEITKSQDNARRSS